MPFDEPSRVTHQLIDRALRGEPEAKRRLATRVVACIDRHIRKLLKRNTACNNRGVVEELVHDVAVYVYGNDAKLLRKWDPSRSTFEYYLGVVARNLVVRKLSQFRGNPVCVTPVDDIHAFLPHCTPEAEITYTLALDQVLDTIEHEMNEDDRHRFEALYVDGLSVETVAKRDGVTTNAIHAWTSRLRKRLRDRLPEVMTLLENSRFG